MVCRMHCDRNPKSLSRLLGIEGGVFHPGSLGLALNSRVVTIEIAGKSSPEPRATHARRKITSRRPIEALHDVHQGLNAAALTSGENDWVVVAICRSLIRTAI